MKFVSKEAKELRHVYVARLLSTIQNGGAQCRILGFFEDKFHRIERILEAQKMVSSLT